MICKTCGSRSGTENVIKGSILIEIILWLFFLVPGLIYSIWRLASKHKTCKNCGSVVLVPVDSPIGQKLINDSNCILDKKSDEKSL